MYYIYIVIEFASSQIAFKRHAHTSDPEIQRTLFWEIQSLFSSNVSASTTLLGSLILPLNSRFGTKQVHESDRTVKVKRIVSRAVFDGKANIHYTNPVFTWRTQQRTEYTLSPWWQRSDDGCLPDVYNMRDAFKRKLRGDGFCQEPTLLQSMISQYKHA
jgi:hypothetical protein